MNTQKETSSSSEGRGGLGPLFPPLVEQSHALASPARPEVLIQVGWGVGILPRASGGLCPPLFASGKTASLVT